MASSLAKATPTKPTPFDRVAAEVRDRMNRGESVDEVLDAAMRTDEFHEVARGPLLLAQEGRCQIERVRERLRLDQPTRGIVDEGLDELLAGLRVQEPHEMLLVQLLPFWRKGRSLVDLTYDLALPPVLEEALADHLMGSIALHALVTAPAPLQFSVANDLAIAFKRGAHEALRVASLMGEVPELPTEDRIDLASEAERYPHRLDKFRKRARASV